MRNSNYILILVSSLFTALSTLGAVFLTNKLNNERLIIQFEIDRKNRQQDLIGAKREELYQLLYQWTHDTQIVDTMFFNIYNGYLSRYYMSPPTQEARDALKNEMYAEEKVYSEKKKELNELYSKIKMIIIIYFPFLDQKFSDINAFRINWVNELEAGFRPFLETFFAGTYEEGRLKIQQKNQELWLLVEELLLLDCNEQSKS